MNTWNQGIRLSTKHPLMSLDTTVTMKRVLLVLTRGVPGPELDEGTWYVHYYQETADGFTFWLRPGFTENTVSLYIRKR